MNYRNQSRRRPRPQNQTPYVIVIFALVALVAVLIFLMSEKKDEGISEKVAELQRDIKEIKTETTEKAPEVYEKPAFLNADEQFAAFKKTMGLCRSSEDFKRLARKADELKLNDTANEYYRLALKKNPDDREANKRLGRIQFSPFEQLASYKKFIRYALLSPKLKPFDEKEGQWLLKGDLERLKTRWDTLKPELDKEADRIEKDPFLHAVNAYVKQMGHRNFMKLLRNGEFEFRDDAKPFAIMIHRNSRRGDNYYDFVADLHAGNLIALYKYFSETFAPELGLDGKSKRKALMLWVLNGRGFYDLQGRIQQGLIENEFRYAHYDSKTKEAITYWDTTDTPEKDRMQHAVLHESVHYLSDMFFPEGVQGISSFWVVEGLAEYLGTLSKGADQNAFPFKGESEELKEGFLSPIESFNGDWPLLLEEILSIGNGQDLMKILGRARRLCPELRSVPDPLVIAWFYNASYCLCRFLDREYPEEYVEYLKRDIRGKGGVASFVSVFGIKSLPDFQWEITRHYAPDRFKSRPKSRRAALLPGASTARHTETSIPDAKPTRPLDEDITRLLREQKDPLITRAWLQSKIFHSGPESASASLRDLLEFTEGDSMNDLRVDLEALELLGPCLDDFFKELSNGEKLWILDESKERLKVESYTSPYLSVRTREDEARTLPLCDLSLKHLDYAISKNQKNNARTIEMMAYLYMFAGQRSGAQKKFERISKDFTPYKSICRNYVKATTIGSLFDLLCCSDEVKTKPRFNDILAGLNDEIAKPVVLSLKPHLRLVVADAMKAEYKTSDLLKSCFSSNSEVRLEDGRFRIACDKFDENELDSDWIWEKSIAINRIPDRLCDALRIIMQVCPNNTIPLVQENALHLDGNLCMMNKVPLEGDITMTLKAYIPDDLQFIFFAGFSQTDDMCAVFTVGFNSLNVIHGQIQGALIKNSKSEVFTHTIGTSLDFTLKKNGDRFSTMVGDKVISSGSYSDLKSCQPFLWYIGLSPLKICSLTIEGDAESQWIVAEIDKQVNYRIDEIFSGI